MTASPEVAPSPAAELEAYRRRCRATFYPKADAPLPDDLLRSLHAGGADAIDPADVARAVRRAMGRAPRSVAPLDDQGTFHRLFRADMGDGCAVIARVNAVGRLGRDFALFIDKWASGRVAVEGLPALHVFLVDVTRQVVPFDYEILAEAQGESLRAFDHDEALIRPRLTTLGRFLARVHEIEITSGAGWIDIAPLVDGGVVIGLFDAWRDYVLLNLDEHIRVCVAIGAIDAGQADRINRAFAACDSLLDIPGSRLLHGDLGNHNVFLDGPEVSALVDWEDCLAGDPAFDIAYWGTFHPHHRRDAFLEGYRSVRALPDDFEVRYWLYFLRVALSKTVHRHRFGYADRPGRPPAARRIVDSLERLEALL
jgi:hypothetical protein